MNNHAPHQQQQQQHSSQADFYGFSSAPHQPPPTSIIHRPPATSFGSVATTASSTSTASKRGRDDGSGPASPAFQAPQHLRHPETIQQYQHYHGGLSSESISPQYATASTPAASTQDDSSYGPASITPKRARPSNYQAPRAVKSSLLSAMGTLASPTTGMKGTTTVFFLGAPSASTSLASTTTTVPMRRRLSGGHLEEYWGNHDNMDMEASSDSRPRSMSF